LPSLRRKQCRHVLHASRRGTASSSVALAKEDCRMTPPLCPHLPNPPEAQCETDPRTTQPSGNLPSTPSCRASRRLCPHNTKGFSMSKLPPSWHYYHVAGGGRPCANRPHNPTPFSSPQPAAATTAHSALSSVATNPSSARSHTAASKISTAPSTSPRTRFSSPSKRSLVSAPPTNSPPGFDSARSHLRGSQFLRTISPTFTRPPRFSNAP